MQCIFCRIANHKLPAETIFEDDKILAISDIAPKAKFHILIIPKKHSSSVDNESSDELLRDVFRAARVIARKLKIEKSGYKIITNVGPHGGQTVSHLHFHLLGGEPLIHSLA